MTELLAWVWTPVLLYVLALGIGLGVDRLLRTELPGALVVPVGLAVAVVLTALGYRTQLPWLVTPLLIIAAVVGLVMTRHKWRRAWSTVPLAAAGLVYLLYLAPVALTGTATWLGYNFVNDTASNFLLIDLLEAGGVKAPADATGGANIGRYLVNVGYPMGAFSLVAGLRPLAGVPVEAIYQPVIAALAAIGGMSLTELVRRTPLRPTAVVVAASLPFGGVLLYRYALHGAIKEILLITLLITAVGVVAVALERRLPVRLVALAAVIALAMVFAFSSAAGVFTLCLAVAALAAAALMKDRPSLAHVGRLVGITLVLAVVALIPTLGSVIEFTQNIRSVFDSSDGATTGALGQLVRPLPLAEGAGVWISRDYRYPGDGPFHDQAVLVAVVAALAGMVTCVLKRWVAPLLLLATTLVPALLIAPLASPYIDAKLLVVLTPVLVFLGALAGLAGLQASRILLRVVGGVMLAGLVAGVLASDLYSYRDARPAPIDRVEAMKDVAAHVPDKGLYLLNEWEEYGKVFMDDARVNPATEATSPRPVRLRSDVGLTPTSKRERTPISGRWFDLDLQTLEYVDGFAGVIMRRSPVASRPPANFRRTYRNAHYELWRRDSRVRVKDHLGLQARDRATGVPACDAVRRLARGAEAGDRLVAAARPRVARLSPLSLERPGGWPISQEAPGSVTTSTPGAIEGTLTAGGFQRVWFRTIARRPVTVRIDGRRVGAARELNTPDQWLDLGTVRLSPGRHRIEISRPGASWPPGDGVYGFLGPLALEAAGRDRLVSVPPRRATELCGRSWDWIELVAGRS